MDKLIAVTINMQDEPNGPIRKLTVVGERLAAGLAITPGVERDDSLHGGWTITHLPSGRMVLPVSICIGCLRIAARKLTEAGIDWTRDMDSIVSDPDLVRTVKDFGFAADSCDGETCSALTDELVG